LKRVIKYTLLIILLLIVVFAIQNYPVSSDAKNLTRLSDTTNIRKNLKSIINTADYRNYKNIEVLDTVAERVRMEFLKHTHRVTVQNYKVNENNYKNIIASFGPEDGERIIVGAHYDVCRDQDGADDNASGVAGILELARLLKDQQLKYRIDLVAYTLEEPPYFNTKQMGSYVHAKSLHDANIPVKGMISLEMIGYYSDKENSQGYPIGLMKGIYGDKGNFITIVQKSFCGQFAKEFKKISFQNNSIATKSFRTPSFLGGANLSDHENYWEFGFSAVMVTNTAFFRNRNYHTKLDKLDALDIPKMGLTIDGVFRTLLHLE
jgi:Zn-dependent M28 family amino/carboxypeptidase